MSSWDDNEQVLEGEEPVGEFVERFWSIVGDSKLKGKENERYKRAKALEDELSMKLRGLDAGFGDPMRDALNAQLTYIRGKTDSAVGKKLDALARHRGFDTVTANASADMAVQPPIQIIKREDKAKGGFWKRK